MLNRRRRLRLTSYPNRRWVGQDGTCCELNSIFIIYKTNSASQLASDKDLMAAAAAAAVVPDSFLLSESSIMGWVASGLGWEQGYENLEKIFVR